MDKFEFLLSKINLSKVISDYKKHHSHNQLMIDLQAAVNAANSLTDKEKDYLNNGLEQIEQEAQDKKIIDEFDSIIISLIEK